MSRQKGPHLSRSICFVPLIALLGLAQAALAATVPTEIRCPLDDTALSVDRPVSSNALGGTDSDYCQYAAGEQARHGEVVTCPQCFYTATIGTFERNLGDSQRQALQEMLDSARRPGQSAASLEVWDRYQLAALCAGVLDERPYERGDLLLTGAWTVRDRVVGFIPQVDGPLDASNQLEELDAHWLEVPDLQIQQMALFDLVRLAHRGGFVARRDAYLAQLDELQPVPPELLQVRSKVRELIELEDRFLAKALEHYEAGVAERDGGPEEQLYYRYLIVDLKRRLGRTEGLMDELNGVLGDPVLPAAIRPMVRSVREVLKQTGGSDGTGSGE